MMIRRCYFIIFATFRRLFAGFFAIIFAFFRFQLSLLRHYFRRRHYAIAFHFMTADDAFQMMPPFSLIRRLSPPTFRRFHAFHS
jgi:hypothetical protein